MGEGQVRESYNCGTRFLSLGRELTVLVGAIFVGVIALAVALGAGRQRLTTVQILSLAGVFVVVAAMAVATVVLPRDPAAIIAILALTWLIVRAMGRGFKIRPKTRSSFCR